MDDKIRNIVKKCSIRYDFFKNSCIFKNANQFKNFLYHDYPIKINVLNKSILYKELVKIEEVKDKLDKLEE